MPVRSIRGAIDVARNEKEEILGKTEALLRAMVRANQVRPQALAAAMFSLTPDLDAEFPALAARRLGWNDGQTESFAFTAIDRLATIGTSVNGSRWRRKRDTAASEITFSGISPIHRAYLANGGYDFLIGDGTLRYGKETVWESYYSAFVGAGFTVSLDAQRVWNPAYNRDRGPLWIASLRLHLEFGVK